ncbi:hypothetical protein C9374_007888 [Naegleria lovaniensis]|uniref:Uncharacterized protein n=1 Tax=Naegleria lovaniensis TaxID=51637 RepID=A0AA88GL25_NAELO|nr:uncharacterized protein C9374_007888 [Naegleria lovaniensis]KAG2378740.1 hypothetical protein C9374_007888 [Naegleria lovaniensis]
MKAVSYNHFKKSYLSSTSSSSSPTCSPKTSSPKPTYLTPPKSGKSKCSSSSLSTSSIASCSSTSSSSSNSSMLMMTPPISLTISISPSPQQECCDLKKKEKKIEQLTALREMRSKSTNELTSQLDLVKNMVRIKEKKGGKVSLSFNFDDDNNASPKMYKKQDKTFNLTKKYSYPEEEEEEVIEANNVDHDKCEDISEVLESICIGEEIFDAHRSGVKSHKKDESESESEGDEEEDEDDIEDNYSDTSPSRKHALTPTRTTKRKYAYFC